MYITRFEFCVFLLLVILPISFGAHYRITKLERMMDAAIQGIVLSSD